MVNVLNHRQTGFPALTEPMMHELCGGPYLVHLARSYITSYRVQQVQNNPYVNLPLHHQHNSQLPGFIAGWIFDQQVPPANWHGVWPGCSEPPHNHGNRQPWEPVRILVIPNVPSRYQSASSHTVILAYVPDHLPLLHPTRGLISPEIQRLKMWLCGPRLVGRCKAGARTVFCCAHVATGVAAAGVWSHNPGLFRTSWRLINNLDSAMETGHARDVIAGLFT